jgi:beta-phosphoglucomutase-like phosphatase (HAD superfamily)
MNLRYTCLVLDHDDTVVDSSATVHFPAYLETIKTIRPDVEPVDLDGWFLKNFDPGILAYLTKELGFTPEEMETEYRVWRSYSSTLKPGFYPGIIDLLTRYVDLGGKIAVVSHSESDIIERDYRETGGAAVTPDLVFGWEMDEGRRKPAPWPVLEVMRRLSIPPEEVLVIDDLKPAVLMARGAGVAVAGAGWGHAIPVIVDYMKSNCDYYLKTVGEFEALLFKE